MASNAKQRENRSRIHRWTRLGIQIVFLILAPSLFSAAFNGVKYLCTQLGSLAPIEITTFLALLIGTLAFTIVFGRFFCGYACAFGTLGDIVFAICEFVRVKLSLPRVKFAPRVVRALSLLKYVVLVGICVACVLGVWTSVSQSSPWVSFAAVLSGSVEGVGVAAFVTLALVIAGMAVRERFFCQFLCPLGAVFSLMPLLGFSAFSRTPEHCAKSCGRCQSTCPVGIWPDENSAAHGECISCGRCADACPLGNVNLIALPKAAGVDAKADGVAVAAAAAAAVASTPDAAAAAAETPDKTAAATSVKASAKAADEKTPDTPARPAKPVRKTKDTWRLVRGTETGVVVAKAAALLLVCWALGSTRYLPTPQEVFALEPAADAPVTADLSADAPAASSSANAGETPSAPATVELQTRELPEEKGGVATLELSMPSEALEGALKDGTYTGYALCGLGNDEDWQPYYIEVDVKVSGGKVTEVTRIEGDTEGSIDPTYVYDAAENSLYLDRAIEGTGGRFSKGALDQIQAFLDSGAQTGGVDTVSGSTYSVVSIVQAYNRAVAEAVAQS